MRISFSAFILCLIFVSVSALGQSAEQPVTKEFAAGLVAIEQGKFQDAQKHFSQAVKREPDSTKAFAWYHLGFVQAKLTAFKEAVKSFEQAIKLKPDYAQSHAALAQIWYGSGLIDAAIEKSLKALTLDASLQGTYVLLIRLYARKGLWEDALREAEHASELFPRESEFLLLQVQALTGSAQDPAYRTVAERKQAVAEGEDKAAEGTKRLERAAAILTRYLQSPGVVDSVWWREQLAAMHFHIEYAKNKLPKLEPRKDPQDTSGRPTITYKEKATYTEQARNLHISGIVTIRAIFGLNGTLENILVMRGLERGLSEKAVEAARKITFKPAFKDGNPIPVAGTLEYSFALY